MICAWVKVWNEAMMPVISVNRITGLIMGKVTCQKRRQAPAPSRLAASYSSVGCTPAPRVGWSSGK